MMRTEKNDSVAMCEDITKLSGGMVKNYRKIDLVWTDPPWENRMVKFFETAYLKDNILEKPGHDINDLLEALFYLIPKKVPAYVEYSVKGHSRVAEIGQAYGHDYTGITTSRQTNGNEYVILHFNTDEIIPEELVGWQPLLHALTFCKPKMVFDPFAGIGQTAEHVLKYSNASYIGSELNPKRYQKLAEVILKHG